MPLTPESRRREETRVERKQQCRPLLSRCFGCCYAAVLLAVSALLLEWLSSEKQRLVRKSLLRFS